MEKKRNFYETKHSGYKDKLLGKWQTLPYYSVTFEYINTYCKSVVALASSLS